MSFDVSSLAAYIENQDFPLVGQIQVQPEMTAADVTLVKGVKGSTKLHLFETDVIFQSGGGCSRSAAGTTSFEDKTLTVGRVAIAEDLCLDDFAGKYLQVKLKQGLLNGKQTMPEDFARVYFDEKKAKLAQAIEIADWQGDTGSLAANYNKYDGLIKLIDAGSPVDGNTGNYTSVSSTNIVAIMRDMFLAIPDNLKFRTDLVCYMPWSWFQLYQQTILSTNLFHYAGGDKEAYIIGTNVKLKPTYGLSTLTYGRMFLTYPSNFVCGIDLESDQEFSYRIDPVTNKKILVDAEWSRGWQVYYTENVVEFTIHGS